MSIPKGITERRRFTEELIENLTGEHAKSMPQCGGDYWNQYYYVKAGRNYYRIDMDIWRQEVEINNTTRQAVVSHS